MKFKMLRKRIMLISGKVPKTPRGGYPFWGDNQLWEKMGDNTFCPRMGDMKFCPGMEGLGKIQLRFFGRWQEIYFKNWIWGTGIIQKKISLRITHPF